jgi:hypothetical protein
MSNKRPPFIEITAENERNLRDQFCNEVGHTDECVNDTVGVMASQLREKAYSEHMHPADYLKTMSLVEFDERLRGLLLVKTCDCGRTKHLN